MYLCWEVTMLEQISGELPLRQVLLALSIFVVFLGLAWLFHVFLGRAARRLAQKTKTKLGDAIISALEKPVVVILVLTGLYLSVLLVPLEAILRSYLSKGLYIALSLLGIYAVAALVYALAGWYRREAIAGREKGLTRLLLRLFQMATVLVAALLGVLVTLANLGIETGPVTGWMAEHGWRIALIVVLSMAAIVAVSRFIPRLIAASVARRPGESEEEVGKRINTLARVLASAGQIVVLFVAAFMVLSELEINIAPILAGAGVVGIAIGFGAQGLIKDLLAGLFIILENQYRVGDVVRIADVAGLVEDINLRRTILRDLDGIVHIVPNGEIRVASNFTKEWSRVNLNVSVAYGEDLDHVISVINRVGKELAEDSEWALLILKAPQVLRVDDLGASGIDIKILGDTKPIRQWDVMGELRKRLKKAFDEEGIEIPWPHTKVYFGNLPPYPGDGKGLAGKSTTNQSVKE
jgi:small conductance mechanosensitive channel